MTLRVPVYKQLGNFRVARWKIDAAHGTPMIDLQRKKPSAKYAT
jgi:hypothetical protein